MRCTPSRRALLIAALIALPLFALAGCGQTGALYFDEDPPADQLPPSRRQPAAAPLPVTPPPAAPAPVAPAAGTPTPEPEADDAAATPPGNPEPTTR
ncbi:MAG: LPS translocon maturation chaperone LptM [Pseudomonadota bacterium]